MFLTSPSSGSAGKILSTWRLYVGRHGEQQQRLDDIFFIVRILSVADFKLVSTAAKRIQFVILFNNLSHEDCDHFLGYPDDLYYL